MVAKTRRFCPPVLICPSETLAYFLNGYIQSYRLNSPSFCPFVFHFCTCHDFGIKEKLIKAPTYGTISLSLAYYRHYIFSCDGIDSKKPN